MKRTADTKQEYAERWISHLKGMWGLYPLDYDKFKASMEELEFQIILKADSLDLPEGEDWSQMMIDACEGNTSEAISS